LVLVVEVEHDPNVYVRVVRSAQPHMMYRKHLQGGARRQLCKGRAAPPFIKWV
jgi:hypothetical protein